MALHHPDLPDIVEIVSGPGGLPVLSIHSPAVEAQIFLHGAQLTHWKPRDAQPVIFLSEHSAFAEGKAIRGGVPICFPWFGPREGDGAHGFARNRAWELSEVAAGKSGIVRVILSLGSTDETLQRWPHAFSARMIYEVGSELEMTLEAANTDNAPMTISEALHTYFIVGDARQCSVTGLDGVDYRDFPDRSKHTRQAGPIRFTEEVDRVYVNTRGTCVLEDPVLRRRITVEKSGSDSTTVWNPWIAKSAALADFGDDEWQRMVCIETVNAFENSVTIGAGERHAMTARIKVESL